MKTPAFPEHLYPFLRRINRTGIRVYGILKSGERTVDATYHSTTVSHAIVEKDKSGISKF